MYAISYTDGANTTSWVSLTLNSTQRTVGGIGATNPGEVLSQCYSSTVGGVGCANATVYLVAGSVVRGQPGAGLTANPNTNTAIFSMTRVA